MGTNTTTPPEAVIPPDDARRKLTMANPEDPNMRHVSVAGGTYTILVTGEQTDGRYSLIDMLVPPGGGPPPYRHDFEEMFTILDGEIELNFRGEAQRASAGSTVKYPCKRASLVQEQVEPAGTSSLHVYASGAGGFLHGSRRSGW